MDALLYQKRKRAEEENIKWECDMQMPKGYCINEFDLCVLFGNILDNALEACGRMQRGGCCFINIQAKTVKKCFLLEVKNSMDRTEKYIEGFTKPLLWIYAICGGLLFPAWQGAKKYSRMWQIGRIHKTCKANSDG